jgi:hypothetical protein
VREAVAARAEALATGGRAGLELLMHPECLWTTHTRLVLERDEYVARNTSEVAWAGQSVELTNVRVEGSTAVALGIVSDTVVEDGRDVHFQMPITFVWVLTSHWRLLAAHAGRAT